MSQHEANFHSAGSGPEESATLRRYGIAELLRIDTN
jgi:hypothetical protein